MKALSVGALVVGLVALVLSASLWMRQPASLASTSTSASAPAPTPSPGPVPLGGKNTPQTAQELGLSIIVLETVNSQCVLETKTPVSHGNKDKDTHWLVINNCGASVQMEFKNFKIGTTSASPFSSNPKFNISPGVQVVKAHVLKTASGNGTDYTFELWLNNALQSDPDIVIDN